LFILWRVYTSIKNIIVFYKIPSTSYKQPSHDLGIFAPQFPMVNVPLFIRDE
jgi:hypothetical protein